jgi:hypothetical protein
MTDALQEETTTLPEGACISISKMKSAGEKRTVLFTELRAYRHGNNNIVKMRVDGVGPVNLRLYLDLIVREITRLRKSYTAKPLIGVTTPHTIADFVQEMACQDMFIFEVLTSAPEKEESKQEENGKQRNERKQRKPRKGKSGTTDAGADKTVPATRGEAPF